MKNLNLHFPKFLNEKSRYHLRNLIYLRMLTPYFSQYAFFIFGCQRSGNTILLSVLNAHPQIVGVDETEFPTPYPFPSAPRLINNRDV